MSYRLVIYLNVPNRKWHCSYTKPPEKVKMVTIFIEDGFKQVWDEERYIKEVNWI
ncbi:hypothetical protein HYH96_08385 [Clostridium botulinum]|uniref:hypothetical protein n=1 Tax=Clostridium botulinum TaxID=1491 RepID=UPI00174DB597|nr:hypothetical protein [Clostridium botulinum]MBD5643914.1 hypothetical protein [Clostridium botulinum]